MSRRTVMQLLGLAAGARLMSSIATGEKLLALQPRAAAPTFPKGAVIRTVLSDISPETLAGGTTLFHEHLSLTMPEAPPGRGAPPPASPPPLRLPGGRPLGSIGTYTKDVELMIDEVNAARKDGVVCIVDAGPTDLKRKVEDLKTIQRRTGVYVVASGGLFNQTSFPPDVSRNSEQQLADEIEQEARRERYGAFGEIGQSAKMTDDERKVFRAVGRAVNRTGMSMFTHTPHEGCKACALEQLAILERMKVDPQRICIGHLADIRDDPKAETHKAIARSGAYVGFDTVGIPTGLSPEAKVAMIVAVLDAGYEDRVMLSSDMAIEGLLKKNGGSGYAIVLTDFLPMLKAAGVKEPVLHKILVDNPRRFLAFVPRPA
jgi:phosphotriesterase-related protein